tara:strand:+ start:399 stop:656 length:258 start_codon:yes stop_codon:yes gene_type:complete
MQFVVAELSVDVKRASASRKHQDNTSIGGDYGYSLAVGVAFHRIGFRIPEHESADHWILKGVFLYPGAAFRAGAQTSNHALQEEI